MWQSPGFVSSIQDVASCRIWHFPRFGVFHDLAFSRMWHSPGCGSPRDLAVAGIGRSGDGSDPSPPTRNPGCFWVQNSVWGRRDPNARVPRALADGPVSFFDGVCAFLGNRPSLFWLGKSKPFMLWSGKNETRVSSTRGYLFVLVVKKENPLHHVHQSIDYGCECVM